VAIRQERGTGKIIFGHRDRFRVITHKNLLSCFHT
jgi:hypothetical protein